MDNNGLPTHRLGLGDAVLRREREATQLTETGSLGLGDSQTKNHNISIMDGVRAFGAGALSIPELAGYASGRLADALEDTNVVGKAYSNLFRAPEAIGNIAGAAKERVESGMSEDAQAARELPFFEEDERGKITGIGDGMKELDVVALKFAEGLGSIVPTLGFGGLAGGVARNAIMKRAAQAGYTKGQAEYIAATAQAQLASKVTGGAAATGVGTAAHIGGAGKDLIEDLKQLPAETRIMSESGKRIYGQVLSEEEWKDKTPFEQQEEMFRRQELELSGSVMTDPRTAALGVAGTILGDVGLLNMLSGAGKQAVKSTIGGGIASSALKGFGMEGVAEGLQGGGQQYLTNEQLIEQAGSDVAPWKGVASSALEEGIIGGLSGGAIGGYSGSRNNKARKQLESAEQQQSELDQQQTDAEVENQTEQQESAPTEIADGPTEITITPEIDRSDFPQVVPSDDARVGREFAFPAGSGDVYQVIESMGGQMYRVANLNTGETLNINTGEARGGLQIDSLIAQYEQNKGPEAQEVNETGDATRTESNPLGPSQLEFDERRDIPSYLRQSGDIDGRDVQPIWSDDEAQQALSRGESAPTVDELIQQEQAQPSEQEQRQIDAAIQSAGFEADSIWRELSNLRVTKRGKPFTSEKEAQMASRKDEQPVKLPEGYGVAKQAEVAEAQESLAKQSQMTESEREQQPAKQTQVAGGPIVEASVADLKLSSDVPQFKDGANKDGIVEALGGTFDRTGVAPIQVWQRNNGDMEVISGRHRLDLARRSGEKTIPAQVHKESDGFDRAAAATLDAELNIRDNQGKVKDYVQYFQATGIDRAEADRRGYTARALGRRAHTIATEGSEETIAAHSAGRITDEGAERISQTAPGDARLQAVGIKSIQDGKSITHATNMMQAVKALSGENQVDGMGDMFGFDDSGMREAEQMATLAANKQREINELLRPQRAVSRSGKRAEQEGITDNLSPEQRKARMENLQDLKAAWDNWSTNPELVAELRNEIKGEEAPVLSNYSEDDLQQQADQVKQAQQVERGAQAKYDADQDVDGFSLTGSDSVADAAMAQGQVDIFADSPTEATSIAEPASSTNEVVESETTSQTPQEFTAADGSRKWFGSEQKAKQLIEKNSATDTHTAEKVGTRWEITPKAVDTAAKPQPAVELDQQDAQGKTIDVRKAKTVREQADIWNSIEPGDTVIDRWGNELPVFGKSGRVITVKRAGEASTKLNVADVTGGGKDVVAALDRLNSKPETKPDSKLDAAAETISKGQQQAADKLKALLAKKRGQLNSGVDPEIIAAVAELGAYSVANGAVKFAQFVRDVMRVARAAGMPEKDIADAKPYLKQSYGAIYADPEAYGIGESVADAMENPREHRKANIDDLIGAEKNEQKATADQGASEAKQLREHIYTGLQGDVEINNNNDLKKVAAQALGINASSVTPLQLKVAQEAYESAAAKLRRTEIQAKLDKGDRARSVFDYAADSYQKQPNLDVRTANSANMQAYSTPTPMALLANLAAGIKQGTTVFEPTAGNGLLLMTADAKTTYANELDPERADSLAWGGYNVTTLDATASPFEGLVPAKVDAVVANPPFGKLRDDNGKPTKMTFSDNQGREYHFGELDHVIAKNALDAMKNDGKAVLILGAPKEAGDYTGNNKVFLNWLYSNHNVAHHVEVSGDMFKGQGAAWPTQMIVIDGKAPNGTGKFAPFKGEVKRLNNWSEIYDSFEQAGAVDTKGHTYHAPKGTGDLLPAHKPAAEPSASQAGITLGSSLDDRGNGAGGSTRPANKPESGGSQPGRGGKIDSGNVGDTRTAQAGGVVEASAQPGAKQGSVNSDQRTDSVELPGKRPSPVGKFAKKEITTAVTKANEFQAEYQTASNGFNDAVLTPVNMASYTQGALRDIQDRHGSVDKFVAGRLGYKTEKELHKAFMGLQADAVALAVDAIEKGRAIIIGDQTGVGKGRQAAGVIRYAMQQGKIPVFITQKPNLFTDMYDDLADIGVKGFKPLIMNQDNGFISKGGKRLYNLAPSARQKALNAITDQMPEGYDGLFLTYSQISSDTRGNKLAVLKRIAPNAMLVMDESHTAAGQDSKLGQAFQGLVNEAAGVTYLSATYAKRPDNTLLYSRTDLGLATDTREALASVIQSGGLGMQTYIAGKLAQAGQMVRRERSFDGISITNKIIEDKGGRVSEQFDQVTETLRAIQDLSAAWREYVESDIAKQIQKESGMDTNISGNQADTKVNVTLFSSVVHNYIAQLSLGLKAKESARLAIQAIKENKRPVITVENTMGAALDAYMAKNMLNVGDSASALTYSTLLDSMADNALAYSVKEPGAKKSERVLVPISQVQSPTVKRLYEQVMSLTSDLDVDVPASPIDAIRAEIQNAGYSVAEITGRELIVDYRDNSAIRHRPKEESDRRAVVDRFNSDKLDVLILNQAGSTGLSIHASERFDDQRPRHMIVAQPSLDINTFMQMLGRVNRTGQTVKPTYDLAWLDLPSEKRPAAVLSRKMSSLNANTSGNTESATSVESVDMLNMYGDKVVKEYVEANREMLGEYSDRLINLPVDDEAVYFLGKLAVMPVAVQNQVLSDIEGEYQNLIEYLNATGQNELNMTELDLDAKPLEQRVLSEGKKGAGVFSEPAYITKVDAKAQGKAPNWDEVQTELANSSQSKFDDAVSQMLADQRYERAIRARLEEAKSDLELMRKDGKKTELQQEAVNKLENRLDNYLSDRELLQEMFGPKGMYRHGAAVRVKLPGYDTAVTGIVTDLAYQHKSGNPASKSKWRVRLTIADRARTIPMAMSQAGEMIEGPRVDSEANLKAVFDRASQLPSREQRYVMTGNLIEAQDRSSSKGRIVPMTTHDGRVIQGMLMPKKFEVETGVREKASLTAKQAFDWLRKSNDNTLTNLGLRTSDGDVVVRKGYRGSYEVEMPKAVSKGKKYWGDPRMTKIIGEQAVKGGGKLNIKLTEQQAGDVIRVMSAINPLGLTNQQQIQNYNNMTGKKLPSFSDKGVRFSRNSDSAPAFIDKVELDAVVERVAPALKRADRVVVVESAAELFALSPAMKEEAIKQGTDGSDIGGVFHEGKVFLVRSAITDAAQAEVILLHESTHAGFVAMMRSKGVKGSVNNLFMAIGGTRGFNEAIGRMGIRDNLDPYIDSVLEKNADGTHKYTESQRNALLLSELVAFTGQQNSNSVKQRVREVIGAIRQWLRSKGYLATAKLSTAEIASIARKARQAGLSGNVKDIPAIYFAISDKSDGGPGNDPGGGSRDGYGGSPDIPSFSRSADKSDAESGLDKLNLGPKPDVIDKAKERVQALREMDRKTASSWITRIGRKANTEMLDALAPIKYVENAIGINDAESSGYIASRLATGSSSTMLGAMLHGLPVWKDGVIQRKKGSTEKDALLGVIEPLGKDLHNWLGWMAGHRAEILMAEGRENLLTADEIQELKALGKGKEKQFNEAKKKWNTFNGAILDLAQESGLVSAESRANFESEWYIPFFREDDDGDVLAPFTNKGTANQRSGIKQLKGGTNKTNDLLENIFHTTGKMIDASMKNHAARKTVENLMDTGIIEVIENPNLMDMRAKDKGQEVFTIRHKGEDVYVRTLDKDLFRAMTFLDRKPFDDPFTKVGMSAKRLLTATVTSSPEFMLRNFLRDALSAWVISKDDYNPMDAIRGAAKAYKMDGGAMDMMFAGSSFMGGYVNANDPQGMADTVRKGLRRKGLSPEQITKYEKSIIRNASQAKGVIADAWAKYNRYGEAAENATREAVYAAAIKSGKSKAQAAFEAKDQMDFSMLGASKLLQWFTAVLPFFNARIQGLGKLSREFKDNPADVAKRGGMIMAGSIALLAANWDNEDYEALPDWDKDMHWHFWLGDEHFRIPKPFEVGVIFGTIPERAVRAMGDKDTGAEFGKAVARAMAETFALNPIPQAVNPIAEVAFNYDSFKGRAIENQYEARLRPEARYDERTSLVMRELGDALGISPKKAEHLVRGYLGSMGAYAMMAADMMVSAGKDEGSSPTSKIWEWPVVKAVYQGDGSSPAKSTKQLGQLYEMLDKVTELHNTVNAYRKDNRIEDANRLVAKEGDVLKARSNLTRAQRQLRQIRNQMDLIRKDRKLTGDEKRERIDRLLIRRNDLAARAVEQNKQWFE